MYRRDFLKLTGLAASASALGALPAGPPAAQAAELGLPVAPGLPALAIPAAGTYQISGRVRLLEPLVEIRSRTTAQSIAWSNAEGSAQPVASFTTFEQFERPGLAPPIEVQGGRLEALSIVPLEYD
jgi:hypothetical protein